MTKPLWESHERGLLLRTRVRVGVWHAKMGIGSRFRNFSNVMIMPNSSIPSKIVIATRESVLALWQANFIRDRLAELYPQTEFSISGMTTRGDQILDKSLSKIGGKGLFIKELEQALEEGARISRCIR